MWTAFSHVFACILSGTYLLSSFCFHCRFLVESFFYNFLNSAMLQFMYSDVLPDVHELTGSASASTSTNLWQHLLAAADPYGLERLKLLCEAKLCEEVIADTVASTMALADQYHCTHLKSICLKFTAAPENLGVVLQTEGFSHLEDACPSLPSDLLSTVAVGDDDPNSLNRKRSDSSIIALDLLDGVDSNGRRMRRRL